MKIVHTYIKTKNGTGFNEYTAYSMLLSVLLAKKHYERVELYCNQEIHDIVREIIGILFGVVIQRVLVNILDIQKTQQIFSPHTYKERSRYKTTYPKNF